jgi:hypothetical protein
MPSTVKVTINRAQLSDEIRKQLHKDIKLQKTVESRGRAKFKGIKKNLISEFKSHSVTRSLGGSSINPLEYGDLFSFIGFSKGTRPIPRLVTLLEEEIYIRFVKFNSRGKARFIINMPSDQDINAASPMPWASGLSWVRGVEDGIPDFGRFLYAENKRSSRSGKGIQVKKEISAREFGGQPYLIEMLKKYRSIFEKGDFLPK